MGGERRCKRKISRFFTFPQAQKAPPFIAMTLTRQIISASNFSRWFRDSFASLGEDCLACISKPAYPQLLFFRTFFSKKVHKSSSIQINNCINPQSAPRKFRGALWGLGLYEWGEWDQSNIPPRFQSFSLSRRVTSQAESSETAL